MKKQEPSRNLRIEPFQFVRMLAKRYEAGGRYPDYQDISTSTLVLLGKELLAEEATKDIFFSIGASGDMSSLQQTVVSRFIVEFVAEHKLSAPDPLNLIISTVMARRIANSELDTSDTTELETFVENRLADKLPLSRQSRRRPIELSEFKRVLMEIDENQRLISLAAPSRTRTFQPGTDYFRTSQDFMSEFEGYAARSLVHKHALFNRNDRALREITVFVGWYLENKIETFLDEMVISRLLSLGDTKVINDLGEYSV